MYHADPSGVYQPHRVGKMHECSPGELLARAVFMHYADKGHSELKHYTTFKGLRTFLLWLPTVLLQMKIFE